MSLVAGCGIGMLYSSSAYFIHEGDTQKGFGLGGMLPIFPCFLNMHIIGAEMWIGPRIDVSS